VTSNSSVYIVLSQSRTWLSRTVKLFTGDQYTHSALALDESLEYMFSFGRRWARNPFIGCFKHESLGDDLYSSYSFLPGAVIQFPVSYETYRGVAAQLWRFLLDGHKFSYNYSGLIGNIAGKGRPRHTRFFCSEFVYHVLHESGVCDLQKPRYTVRPQDLLGLGGTLIFEGNLKAYRPAAFLEKAQNRVVSFGGLIQELQNREGAHSDDCI
jgi:hypothetical protein